MHVTGCIKIASFSKLLGVARIVTELRVIQAQLHIAGKWNRAALADFLLNFVTKGHKPSRCRSTRSCGVRMHVEVISVYGDRRILELYDQLDAIALGASRKVQQRVLVEPQLSEDTIKP